MKFCSIAIAVLSALLMSIAVHPAQVWSQDSVAAPESGAPQAAPPAATENPPPPSPAIAPLDKNFFQALNLITANQFSAASEKFTQLKTMAAQEGFENLPGFSMTLMERAEQFLSSGAKDKAAFLLRRAQELSPRDARISLGLARFPELIGYSDAAALCFRGLWWSLDSPVVLAALLANGLLLGLAGLTIAVTVTCIVQLAKRRDLVFTCVYGALPAKCRGILGPPAVLALLVLPVFGGVLLALICWSLLLAKAMRPGKQLAIIVGFIVIVWGLSLPVLSSALRNSTNRVTWLVEGLQLRSYLQNAVSDLENARLTDKDPLIQFSYAHAAMSAGQLDLAKTEYERLLGSVPATSRFGKVIRFHLAALDFTEGNFAAAREQFEKLETDLGSSFESAYNLSLVHLAELDTEGQRKFFEAAREMDSARLSRLESDASDHPAPLLIGAPRMQFFQFMLRPHGFSIDASKDAARAVSSRLFVRASPEFLIVLGIVTLLIGAFGKSFMQPVDSERAGMQPLFWECVPGGAGFSGTQLARGALTLALFLAALLAGAETPVHLIPIVPVSRTMGSMFFAFAAVMLGVTWLLTFVTARLRKR